MQRGLSGCGDTDLFASLQRERAAFIKSHSIYKIIAFKIYVIHGNTPASFGE